MANFSVVKSIDNGQGDVEGSLSWAIKRANQTAGDDTITLTTDIELEGEARQLIDSNITLEGQGASLDGDAAFNISGSNNYRPLFIRSGTVTIRNIDIVNGRVSSLGGGGDSGAFGGGLFVYSGQVTLSNVDIKNNRVESYGNGANSGAGGSFSPFSLGGSAGASMAGSRDGGDGGPGGFGSGGGAGGDGKNGSAPGDGGQGGAGGFGGGGGGGGNPGLFRDFYFGYTGRGGAGGFGAGNGTDSDQQNVDSIAGYGGYGAALGGGAFIRTGQLNLVDVDFVNNVAISGSDYISNRGLGLGGGLFALHIIENTNGNSIGMPDVLPVVNISSATFSRNKATDASRNNQAGIGESLDNDAVFGTTTAVAEPEISTETLLEGTSRRDVLKGSMLSDKILGLGGNDVLSGNEGDDVVDGGNGNDRVLGKSGNDQLIGGTGNDRLLGGAGDDQLLGGQGRDRLIGGTGNDRLFGDGGNDFLDAGMGNDSLDGGRGNDKLLGGTGNDSLTGFTGNDSLQGGAGNDRLSGGQGRDQLTGGAGDDDLIGGTGNDLLIGGAGNDRLVGGEGRDILSGGAGRDVFAIASGGRLPVRDIITDFTSGQDTIELIDLSFGALTFTGNRIAIAETNEVIATLTGIDTTTLTGADFIWT